VENDDSTAWFHLQISVRFRRAAVYNRAHPLAYLERTRMGIRLNIAYKSQYDSDASVSRNDCGPTCLAMLINAHGVAVTTDAVFRRTGVPAEAYISMAHLMRVGESYGVPLEYRRDLTLADLHNALDQARPAIALVHYGAFSSIQPGVSTQSKFAGPHFVLAVGYEADFVLVHDPLWTGERRREGAFKKWRNDIWMQAWGRCHEDCEAEHRCNPDFAALISVHAVKAGLQAPAAPDTLRRIRAKASLDGVSQPDLAQPSTLNSYRAALGDWGQQAVSRTVEPSDTLWRLAKAYYGDGTKMNVIRYFNGLDESDVIQDGQVLLIPEPSLPGAIPEDRRPTGVTPASRVDVARA
jgi:hypothetical protein